MKSTVMGWRLGIWLLLAGWLSILPVSPVWAQSEPGSAGLAGESGRDAAEPASPVSSAQTPASALLVGSGEGSEWSIGVSAEDQEAAAELFQKANQMANQLYLASAMERYKQALGHWNHPAIHYNMAIVQLQLQQTIAAYESLQQAIRYGAAPLGIGEEGENAYEEARRHLKVLQNNLVRVEIVCSEPGAQVTMNGRRLFVGPGKFSGVIEPGAYQLAARKKGMIEDVRQEVFPVGEEVRYELVLKQWITERRYSPWWSRIVVSAGVAALAAGGAFHWQAAEEFRRFDEGIVGNCPEDPKVGCMVTEKLKEVLPRAEERRMYALAGYAAGSALLLAGAILFYGNHEQRVEREVRRDSGAISVVPAIGPSTWAMSAELRF